MIIDDDTLRAVRSENGHLAHRLSHGWRNFNVAKSLRFRLQRTERVEEQNTSAHQRFQMLLHSLEDSCGRIGGGNLLRESIEIANFVFPLERPRSAAPRLCREIAKRQRNDEKEDDAQHLRSRIGTVDIKRA